MAKLFQVRRSVRPVYWLVIVLLSVGQSAWAQSALETGGGDLAGNEVPEKDSRPDWLLAQNLNTSGEGLFSEDYQLTQWSVQYGHDYAETEWDFALTYETYDLRVKSSDFFFPQDHPVTVHKDRILGQFNIMRPLQSKLTLQGQVSVYDGYQNYRSLWAHEYYRQVNLTYQEFGYDPYPEASPWGYQMNSQLRWEYLPANGYLEAGFGFFTDQIVPSSDYGEMLLLGPDSIDSMTYRLATENLLNPRMRSLVEVQLTDTSVREKRYSVQGSLNTAVYESVVLRLQAGWVTEQPEFEAYFVGGNLEYELNPTWTIGAFGRFYTDTGEIQDTLTINPPGLKSWQLGLSLRWVGENSSVKVGAGPYFTRYDEIFDFGFDPYGDLYRSRDWISFQVAWSTSF